MNIFDIKNEAEFEQSCLETFHLQVADCEPYRRYVQALQVEIAEVDSLSKIPFLPIEFFKSERIICKDLVPELTFVSSGTTANTTSTHYVAQSALYEEAFTKGFERVYGAVEKYCILALLPSYLERQNSSLVYMAQDLITKSKHSLSGFFLYNHEALKTCLDELKEADQPTILLGVSFALLDFAKEFTIDFPSLTIIETGGMKGRQKEIVRTELHEILQNSFGVEHIHSEYGMTELLSQAYSKGGAFYAPPWMRIVVRDVNNPFAKVENGRIGGVNVIDLANRYSCSFIETQDLGRILPHGGFEILGRIDASDLRGCNMLL
ncbi:MAG: acyltransferase [Bacteroidales bacterium]